LGRIVDLAPQQKQGAFVVLQLRSLSTANQQASFESHPLRLEAKKRSLLGSILGGAGAGVVVGGIVDGKKGAARGAALGAAAGAIAGARMQGKHLVLPAGTELNFVVACCHAKLQLAN
jgi:outer membrane lipoprotein SlyB